MNYNSPKLNYIIMTSLVFICAFEYILTKPLLDIVPVMTVIWLKYAVGFAVIVGVKIARGGPIQFALRDLPVFVLLALFGEVIYYFTGFSSMSYLPVALLTVMIAMAPVLSVIFDRFIYKRKVRAPAILGICVSLFGISMVAGVDPEMLAGGRAVGYLLAILPAISANMYNILAIRVTKRYNTFDMAIYVIGATVAVSAPFGLGHLPPADAVDAAFVMTVIFLGVLVAAFGVFAYLNSLKTLGATTSLLFSNFVPVVACVFGWLLLGETILPLQLIGGAIALTGCAAVIWYKGRTEIFNKR